jgi:hypothetical protein
MVAEINAAIRNVKPVRTKSPPVRNKTKVAASAAMGNANRKPKTTIAINPMISKMISNHKSDVVSSGVLICKVTKKLTSNYKVNFQKYINNFETITLAGG